MQIEKIDPGPGQESVWDYPRPPRLEETQRRIRVVFNGVVIADTCRAKRVLETSHPPVYYIPPEDILMEHLIRTGKSSHCEWKGIALYYSSEPTFEQAMLGRRVPHRVTAYVTSTTKEPDERPPG